MIFRCLTKVAAFQCLSDQRKLKFEKCTLVQVIGLPVFQPGKLCSEVATKREENKVAKIFTFYMVALRQKSKTIWQFHFGSHCIDAGAFDNFALIEENRDTSNRDTFANKNVFIKKK